MIDHKAKRRMDGRNRFSTATIGFIYSIGAADRVCEHAVETLPSNSPQLDYSKAQFVIFCVRSLETLLRDLIISAATSDQTFLEDAKKKYWKPKQGSFCDQDPISLDKLFLKQSFQSLVSVKEVYHLLLGKPLFETLSSDDTSPVFLASKEGKVSAALLGRQELFSRIEQDLMRLFDMRHEFVHNAHYPVAITSAQTSFWAERTLYYGQLICSLVRRRIAVNFQPPESPPETLCIGLRASELFFLRTVISYDSSSTQDIPKAMEVIKQVKMKEDAAVAKDPDHFFKPNNLSGIGPFFLSLENLRNIVLEDLPFINSKFDPTNAVPHFYFDSERRLRLGELTKKVT